MEKLKAKFNAWLKTKSVQWCKAAGIRALKTVLCAAIGLIPAGATISAVDFRLMIGSVVISAVDWRTILSTAALACLSSVLLSMMTGLPEVDNEEKGAE